MWHPQKGVMGASWDAMQQHGSTLPIALATEIEQTQNRVQGMKFGRDIVSRRAQTQRIGTELLHEALMTTKGRLRRSFAASSNADVVCTCCLQLPFIRCGSERGIDSHPQQLCTRSLTSPAYSMVGITAASWVTSPLIACNLSGRVLDSLSACSVISMFSKRTLLVIL